MQIYASLIVYSYGCIHFLAGIIVYNPFVGLIRVARFDLMGSEGLTPWNERQELAPRSFLYGII